MISSNTTIDYYYYYYYVSIQQQRLITYLRIPFQICPAGKKIDFQIISLRSYLPWSEPSHLPE